MRAPKVRTAKQRGKQYNSNLARGSPMHYAVAGACVFAWSGEKKCCFVLCAGVSYYYVGTIEIRYGLPGTVSK